MTEGTLAARIEAELERDRQARFSEFDPEQLAWLAFPPVWTDRLARASGFPQRPFALEELLDRAEAVGWCVRRTTKVRARTPALRLHLLLELGELGSTHEVLRGILDLPDEALRAQLLARLATVLPTDAAPDLIPEIHAAARRMSDPVAAADVMLAIATRDGEHAESVRLYLRGLLDQIADPEARVTRLLRFRELMVVQTRTWRREFLDYLVRIQSPALVARLLRDAAPWLEEDDVPSLAPQTPDALGATAVALARSGHHDRARELADLITDERLRIRTLAELLVPLTKERAGTGASDLERRCLDESRRAADLVTRTHVLTCIAQAGRPLRTGHLMDVAERATATSAHVAALQRLTAAVVPAGTGEVVSRLVRRSTELAAQVPDLVSQVSHLAEAIRLFSAHGVLDQVDPISLIATARAVHDDEDRARAFASLAVRLPESGRDLAAAAMRLADQLDAGVIVTTFWVHDSARREILGELQRQPGYRWVQGVTGTIGRRVRDVRQRGEPVPEAMARWAELAAEAERGGPRGAASALEDRVRLPLDVGETGPSLAWLDTAGSLAPLLLGEFETAVVANTRRVELVHRREQDRKRLAEFLPRAGQVQAFERLLDEDEEGGPWALHYLGVGGVGKTTLIRYLTAQLAPQLDVVTSRIDFDHINPDYPRRRPAQLLLELATELRAHAQDRRETTLFEQAYEQLLEINAAALPGAAPITVSDTRFARAIRTFGGFLEALDKPVVLILDTCEELEKFQPVSGRMEQLEATFDLIEALHEVTTRLRVVLAGRRPLARSGHGWLLADRGDETRVLLPEERPYLLVHEVRGFDRAEAEEFLGPGHKGLDLSPEMLEAILARSPDPGTAAPLEWTEAEATESQPDGPCYNPFDLDHYANWVRSEPSLRARDVRDRERDIYVESRIIGRLKRPDVEHADLERLLPAVAALGRFERDMLRPAFDGDETAFGEAWREFAAAEWTELQFDAALDTTFLKVDDGLRPRLEAYYQRPEHHGLHQEAARRLGPGLARLVDERPLERLGVDHALAALRLLPPEEAARLVDRLAWKVIEEARWNWAAQVIERVFAHQPALGRSKHPAAAGLWAMRASALVHLDPERDQVLDTWYSVEAAVSAHPDEETRTWLGLRTYLAEGGAIRSSSSLAKTAEVRERLQGSVLAAVAEEPDQRRRQVLLGGLLAAVADKLDEVEADERLTVEIDPNALETAVLTEPPAVRAFVRVLSARAFLLDGRFDEAKRLFAEAVALVTQPGPEPSPWLCADWAAPEDLVRRVWLEALRAPIEQVGSPSLGPPPMPEGRLGGIDADRFASAALLRRLAHEVVPAEELSVYERFEDLLEIRPPACQAHRAVPPFFVTVARGWIVLGEAERARALLQRGERAAVGSRDPELVKQVNLARLEVVRRFRHPGWDRSLQAQMLTSDDPAEREAAAAVSALVRTSTRDAPRLDVPAETVGLLRQEVSDLLEGAGIQRAGPRRVTELLFERAELFVLVHPSLAGSILDSVATSFERIGDTFGTFAATVTAVLARARAGESPRLGAAGRLVEVHEALRQEHPDSVPELQGETRAVDRFRGSVWEGWMYRLLVALAWASRSDAVPGLLEAVTEAGGRSPELEVQALPDRPGVIRRPSSTAKPASPPAAAALPSAPSEAVRAEPPAPRQVTPEREESRPSRGRPRLTVISPGEAYGRTIPLAPGWIDIGRSPGVEVVIDDPDISRQHALVEWTGDRVVLEDLGSTNGTWVNGDRIRRRVLHDGDRIHMGSTELQFSAGTERGDAGGDRIEYHGGVVKADRGGHVIGGARPATGPAPPARASRRRAHRVTPDLDWAAGPPASIGRRGILRSGLLLLIAVAVVGTVAWWALDVRLFDPDAPTTTTAPGPTGSTTSPPPTTTPESTTPPPGDRGGLPRVITVLSVPVLVGLLCLLALGWRPLQAWRYRRRLSSRAMLSLSVVLYVENAVERVTWTLDRRGSETVQETGSMPGFGPYERQVEVLPEPVRRRLQAGNPGRGLALHAPSGHDAPAWEALALLALGESEVPCWRPRPSRPGSARRRRWVIRRVRCFTLATPTWGGVLRNLHGRTRGELVGPVGSQPGEAVTGASPVPAGDALVLLGTPVETSAGLRLRVASVTLERSQPEDVVEPDSLGLEGSAYSLVVVVGEPSESLNRIDAEREQAADLRRVAADLVNAGAVMVLCLPAMPPDLAGEVLKLLGGHLHRIRAFGPWELVRASTRIRRKIAAAGTTEEERAGAKELALDVTVWIRP